MGSCLTWKQVERRQQLREIQALFEETGWCYSYPELRLLAKLRGGLHPRAATVTRCCLYNAVGQQAVALAVWNTSRQSLN